MNEAWNAIRQNIRLVKTSAIVLLCACLFGGIEFILWGRTHWEEGAMLMALLLLGIYDQLRRPMQSLTTNRSRIGGWAMLVLAGLFMLLSSRLRAEELGMVCTLCKNFKAR